MTTHSIGHDRIVMGQHRTGATFARATLVHGAGSVTVEGTGRDAMTARAHLNMLLRDVEHDAGDIADQLARELFEEDEA